VKLTDTAITLGVRAALRATFKTPSRIPLPLPLLRRGMEMSAQFFRTRPDVGVHSTRMGDVPCELVRPLEPVSRVILHLHGGAFFAGSPNTHRAFAAEIAVRTQAEVYVLDYRLAPEHSYPAPLEDCLAAYKGLLAAGHAPERILIAGDSGGSALALSLAIMLREEGLPLPAGLILISPFVDLSLRNHSVRDNAFWDPMITAKALRRGAKGYRGRIPADDPRVSPIFADLEGLPPLLIQVGEDEILQDDALLLAEKAKKAGVWVDCRVYAGMWHNFQMFSDLVATADEALDEMGGFAQALVP
jgi:acetyl esterase/lipase